MPRRLLSVTLVGVAVGAIVAGSLTGLGGPLAYLLPPLVLLVALAMRRYPGERVLLALMARARRKRPRAPRVTRCRGRRGVSCCRAVGG